MGSYPKVLGLIFEAVLVKKRCIIGRKKTGEVSEVYVRVYFTLGDHELLIYNHNLQPQFTTKWQKKMPELTI